MRSKAEHLLSVISGLSKNLYNKFKKEYMKAIISHKLEVLHLKDSDENIWKDIDDVFHNYQDVIDTIDYFILNLKSDHEVPYKIYLKLCDMGQTIKDHKSYTTKMRRYITVALASYWYDLNEEAKFQIQLL
jgi:hypothetical protein